MNAFQLVGRDQTLQLFGVRLIGLSVQNAKRLIFTLIFLLLVYALARILTGIANRLFGKRIGRTQFWTKQGIRLIVALLVITGLVSIWFNNPASLGSAAAFVTAGLAVASQRVITAISGYLIILQGKTFNVGDRIVMGGVRGDVIALSFMQTTIMEMGEPPGEQGDAPSQWVASRQYTGRIVTISNANIFDQPVYNYTRDFPYIWEEMRLPIPYNAEHKKAEAAILESVNRHTTTLQELGEDALNALERRYSVKREEFEPRVYWRLTDNWVEMSVRFVVPDHGIRPIKDAISRDILTALNAARIGIASGTYEIVGMPELKVKIANDSTPSGG
jgi:small-conductance mechanosensitive channel